MWAPPPPAFAHDCGCERRIVSDLRLALLDGGFARRIARWPEIRAAPV